MVESILAYQQPRWSPKPLSEVGDIVPVTRGKGAILSCLHNSMQACYIAFGGMPPPVPCNDGVWDSMSLNTSESLVVDFIK